MKKTNLPFVTNLKIDKEKLPKHIAIIMDGNRRWAVKRGLTPGEGHKAGAQNLENIVNYCRDIGIKNITVYALSTENWRKRSAEEVKGIFNLLIQVVKTKRKEYQKTGIKFFVLGNFQAFPFKVKNAIKKILDEIVNAIQNIIKDGVKARDVNEELVSKYLYTTGQPDPDLIIRPGGEFRLSNFLLWQMSYAELYFTNILWPDFTPKELEKAIYWYQQRDRRLGK